MIDLQKTETFAKKCKDLALDPEIDMYGVFELQSEFEVAGDTIRFLSNEVGFLRKENDILLSKISMLEKMLARYEDLGKYEDIACLIKEVDAELKEKQKNFEERQVEDFDFEER